MKFSHPLLLVYLLSFSLTALCQTTPLIIRNGATVGDSDVYNRGQQELKRTQDPVLKTVPVERIISANAVRSSLLNVQPKASKPTANPTVINTLQWNERGPTNVGGRTRGLLFDLGDAANGYKKVFAGGVGGGIWYTHDITATPVGWTRVNDFFNNIAISFIVQNPVNPLVIYASTGEGFGVYTKGLGVWKSADGGTTWSQLTSTASFSYITSMLVDKNGNVYLAADNYGIQRSTDGGSTWTQVLGSPVFGAGSDGADLELAASGDIYAATGDFSTGQIFTSSATVSGTSLGSAGTWTNITPDTKGVLTASTADWWRIKLACAPSDPNTVYALLNGSNQYAATSLQRYNKLTNTWAVKTLSSETFSNDQGWYALAMAVDPNDASTLLAGSLDLQKSADGGTTWSQLSYWANDETSPVYVHADHQNYVYAPGSSSRAIMGTDGGVSYSSTMNATTPSFLTQDNGYDVTQFYSVALHPTSLNYALAGAQDNGSQQFTTAGLGATNDASDGDGGDAFIDQLNPKIQITSYTYNNHWISTDGGLTFNEVFFNDKGGFINPSDYDSKNEILYSGNTAGSYFRWSQVALASTKTGVSVPVAAFAGAFITHVTVSPITDSRVFFGLDNGTVVIVNNANATSGLTTSILTPSTAINIGSSSVSSISIDPASEAHLMVTYSNYGVSHVFETKNAFAAAPVWTDIDGNLPDMPVRWSMFYPGDSTMAVIATELGVWTTNSLNSSSTSWLPTNTGLANTRVDMLKYRALDKTLAAASYGRGLFTAIIPATGKLQQTIVFAATDTVKYGVADLQANATSANSTIPVTYTSSNTAVCTITPAGLIHILSKGSSILTASQAGNVTYSAAIPATQVFTVLPAMLTITALNETKHYSDPLPPLPLTYSGFVKGDTLSSLKSIPVTSTAATASSPTGAYPILVTGAVADSNYTVKIVTGILTITAAPAPTITAISTGTVKAGSQIILTGTYLLGATSVSFGGIAATSFTVNSASSITAVVGTGATGLVSATTTTGTGTYSGVIYIPVPVITATGVPVIYNGGSLVLNASPATGYTFQWIKDGVEIDGAIGASYTALQPGAYSVEISLNGVSQVSAGKQINALSGSDPANFTLTASSSICSGSTDGTITLIGAQHLAYTATLTLGNVNTIYQFTDTLKLVGLKTGSYNLCITLAGLPSYSQCYPAVITPFQLIGLKTTTDNIAKRVNLILSGSATYIIDLNKVITTTTDSLISLPLILGVNTLTVSTAYSCQGTITRTFTSNNKLFAFPNPFISSLSVDLGKTVVLKAIISLYTPEGLLVYSGSYTNTSGVVTITPSGLTTGVYILKLVTDGTESVFNLLRK